MFLPPLVRAVLESNGFVDKNLRPSKGKTLQVAQNLEIVMIRGDGKASTCLSLSLLLEN